MYLALANLLVGPRHPAGAGDGSEEGDDIGNDCNDGDVWGDEHGLAALGSLT